MRPYRWRPLRPLFLWWWRLHERDVTDLGTPPPADTKGPPSYQYGKVTGLSPDLRVITETSESPYVCCGYCSAGMACWTARTGVTHSMAGAAHPIRSSAGRPHNNGSKATELRNGAREAHGVTLDPLAVAEIPDQLRAGFAVQVNLDYAQLPGYLKVQSGSFGHSCCLYGWQESSDRVGFFDPLWPEGAYGAWAVWSDVKAALWGDGEHSATVTSSGAKPPDDTTGGGTPCPPDRYADGYRAGRQYGRLEGIGEKTDAVFRSWSPGRPFEPPDDLAGAQWGFATWSGSPAAKTGDPWAAWPMPLAAVWAAQYPAEWGGAGWASAVWRVSSGETIH